MTLETDIEQVQVVKVDSEYLKSSYKAKETPADLEDLMGVLRTNYHHSIVHPAILGEGGFKATVYPEGNSATFTEKTENFLAILSPVGKFGIQLSFSMLLSSSYGILIGITENQKEELSQRFKKFGMHSPLKTREEWLNHSYILDDFDLDLKDSQYSKLRRSVGKGVREGLIFEKAEEGDTEALVELYDSWRLFMEERGKKIDVDVRDRVQSYSRRPFYEAYMVKNKGGQLLAAAFVGITGITACGDIKIIARNQSQASEFLDYMMFKLLKEKGVKFYDNGHIEINKLDEYGGLIEYKRRFNPIEEKLFVIDYKLQIM